VALPYRRLLEQPSALAGGIFLLLVILAAIFADLLFPGNPWRMAGRPNLPLLSPGFPLGTDMLGRDLAAAIVHGARVSLLIALVSTACAVLVGTFAGAVAGYFGGVVDDVIMRVTEFFQTIPAFLLTVVIVAITVPSLTSIVSAIAVVSWPSIARLVRAETLGIAALDYVKAARIAGLSTPRIIIGHVLPNALAPIIVAASLMTGTAIMIESGISFLGLGDRSAVSWGFLIGTGRTAFRVNWWLSVVPGVAIVLTVLALNLVGDGLNHWLNPRTRRGGGGGA
jgi:peptide/nickel transport system permease protein